MGKGNDAPKAPSYTKESKSAKKITAAATKGAKTQQKRSDQQYDVFKEQSTKDRAIAAPIISGQGDIAAAAGNAARDYGARFQNVYQPLEDDLIQEYKDYLTPGRYDQNRGRAQASVTEQFKGQRAEAQRALESYGLNPGAVRYAALDLPVRNAESAARAAAANNADVMTENTARGLRSQALELGTRYPGWQLGEEGMAVNAGNAAVNNQLSLTGMEAQTTGTAPQYAGLGVQYLGAATGANQSAANIKNTSYQNENAAFQQQFDADNAWVEPVASIAGLAAGAASKAYFTPAAATGGAIPEPSSMVPQSASPTGGAAIDDVPARLTPGEFVLPEDVTRWIGEKKLQEMIMKTRDERKGAPAKPQAKPAVPQAPTYASPGAIPMRR